MEQSILQFSEYSPLVSFSSLNFISGFSSINVIVSKLYDCSIPNFFSIIMPKAKESIDLGDIDSEEMEKYIPEKLGVKVFLEFNS